MFLTGEELMKEFNELIEIAQFALVEKQDKGLTVEQFLQLCLDIRTAERGTTDLRNKNVIIPERIILQ